ncbi:uncharacterized protein K441DRAFT_705615 [Cenococcum geophilum 1.58]|uniref:uncharacterized protein n=1 Tax=Cenococcum geophilum 1.58 TaxID=794803 RepID=UPI00358E5BCF|nr:hypothetical protein K441DRAFT_705615 [Cenococcum geophilum 1.58]
MTRPRRNLSRRVVIAAPRFSTNEVTLVDVESALYCLALSAVALPTADATGRTCSNPPYVNAVPCLTKKAISGIAGIVNRFDDHQAGHFILWHRYFVTTYEKALRDECGYTGGQPSTNLTGTAIYQTTIFDPNTSFSGNGPYVEATTEQNPLNITGHTDDGCVFKWPLRALEIHGDLTGGEHLRRDFTPWVMNSFVQQSLVDHVQSQTTPALQGPLRISQASASRSGRFGVGGVLGTIGNAANSPDPLFFFQWGSWPGTGIPGAAHSATLIKLCQDPSNFGI